MNIIAIRSGVLVTQPPRTTAVYGVDAPLWADDQDVTVTSLRPVGLEASLTVRVVSRVMDSVQRSPGHGHARGRSDALSCVEVSGGIAGARYEIRLSPTCAFQVRVTGRKQT